MDGAYLDAPDQADAAKTRDVHDDRKRRSAVVEAVRATGRPVILVPAAQKVHETGGHRLRAAEPIREIHAAVREAG